MYINTNVSALFAENALQNTQNTLTGIQQEMSTGYQINSPSDNPSGLAISNLMQGELGGINSAINNATQASNLLNVANGGMQTDVQIVQQIQQLAVQASNGTNNAQDTQDIQNQINQLLQSLDNVSQTLNYNNQLILNQGPSTTTPSDVGTNEAVLLGSVATGSIAFLAGATVGAAGATTGTYTVNEEYSAKYSAATTGSGNFIATVAVTSAYAGSYSIAVSSVVQGGTTVALATVTYDGVTSSATVADGGSGTAAISLDGLNVTLSLASVSATATDETINVSGIGTYTVSADLGGTAIGTTTFNAAFTSGNASTGTYSVALGSLTFGLDLASVSSGADTTASTITQDVQINSAISNLTVGADSGALPPGLYSVAVSYSTVNGVGIDTVQISNAAGSVVALGSVANLSSTGNVELQLVSGDNSSGPYSFVVSVNQSVLGQMNGATAVSGVTVTGGVQYNFQTGPNQGNGNSIQTQFGNFNSTTLGLNSIDVNTNPQYAVTQSQYALSMLTNAQGAVGAQIDQINYTLTSLQTETTNLQASRAAIMDANMATVTSQFAQQQILMQTGIQALSTAQQLPALVLKLLS